MFTIGYMDMNIEVNQVLYAKGQTIAGVGLIVSVAFNLALTLLTAGRIWWIARALKPSKTRTTRTINKIILESGMLYPLVTIFHLGVTNSPNPPLQTLPLVVLAAVC
ncbi:hypothetical protein PM082_013716 [Marasmius tenuissimus]|nr:hypothetical protein PM082_013716 [Marasmius tenuissimus]